MSDHAPDSAPAEVDPSLEAAADLGLTPPEHITVMTVRVNAVGASTWNYSISHEDAATILREIADQIDLKAAAEAEQGT
jgi:hypothetical protein